MIEFWNCALSFLSEESEWPVETVGLRNAVQLQDVSGFCLQLQ